MEASKSAVDSIPVTLKPTNDFVLMTIETPSDYNKYKNVAPSLVLPDKWAHGPEDRPVWGKVIAKGNRCRNNEVSVGNRILVGKWDGARVPYKDSTYILIKEADILAVDV